MPFDAEGRFQRLFSWVKDRDRGIEIRAERMDLEMDGMVKAINKITAGEVPFGAVCVTPGAVSAPGVRFKGHEGTGFYCRTDGTIGLALEGHEIGILSPDFFEKVKKLAEEKQGEAIYATKQEALDGRDNLKIMTPLRVFEAMRAISSTAKTELHVISLHEYRVFSATGTSEEGHGSHIWVGVLPYGALWNIDRNGHLVLDL